MSDSINCQNQLSQQHCQTSACQIICLDCVFHTQVAGTIACIHPDEAEANCSTVTFCNSFQPTREIESPCVSFGNDDEK